MPSDGAAYTAMKQKAYEQAWMHISRHQVAGSGPHGVGPILEARGPLWYHGHEREDHVFRYHKREPEMNKKIGLWRPETDTLSLPNLFCTNCTYTRSHGQVQVFSCNGHEPLSMVPSTATEEVPADSGEVEIGHVDTFSSDDYDVSNFRANFVRGPALSSVVTIITSCLKTGKVLRRL